MSNQENKICKITVVRRTIHQDLYKEIRGKEGVKCEVFEDGQEIIVHSPFEPPQGFCPWAWADIRTFVHGIIGGMRYGDADAFVSCCSDGFRPVLFKIEMVNAE